MTIVRPDEAGEPDAEHHVRAQLARFVAARGNEPLWEHATGPLDGSPTRGAAVLVLFGRLDALPAHHTAAAVGRDVDVLLLARAATLASHPGQVSFPGGRVDPGDVDAPDTALREAVEETGLDRSGVDVLGALAPLPLAVSNHLVTPVVAWWTHPTPVRPVDAAESSQVFRVPVADLLDPARRGVAVARRGAHTFRSPAFQIAPDGVEHVVWGFTGLILDALFDRLGWAEAWDRRRVLDVSR